MIQKPVEPVVTDFLYRHAAQLGSPLSGTFELTPLCNMNCKMCYVRLKPDEQKAIRPLADADTWLSLGKKCRDAGMLYLLLTGGEPTTHPQFLEILRGLHELGLIISLNTNGIAIDEEMVSWLKQVSPARVNVTLYGASNDTYARLCGCREGYTRTVRGISLMREAGIPVKINCSVTPDNAKDIPKIASFCKDNDLILQATAYMFPPTRRDRNRAGENFRFSPEDAAFYTALTELLTDGKDRFLSKKLPCLSDDEECAQIGDGVRCRAGRCSFWVTWNGSLLPCGMFEPQSAPNVFDMDFNDAWTMIKAKTAQIRLPAKCSGCGLQKQCRACAAMVYTESGCFDRVPAYRCEMAHAFPGQRLRLKKMLLDGPIPEWMMEG